MISVQPVKVKFREGIRYGFTISDGNRKERIAVWHDVPQDDVSILKKIVRTIVRLRNAEALAILHDAYNSKLSFQMGQRTYSYDKVKSVLEQTWSVRTGQMPEIVPRSKARPEAAPLGYYVNKGDVLFSCIENTATKHRVGDDRYHTVCGLAQAGPTEDKPNLFYEHKLPVTVRCTVCFP